MIVKVAHPKRQDNFLTLANYIARDAPAASNSRKTDNFATLSRYMTREENFKAVASNCGCEANDINTAIAVIKATQNLNHRAKKKSLHLIVSFAAGENPTESQLAYIEQRLAKSIGMHDLQRIRVVHTDTNHLHMHIAINRIDPETHRSTQPSRDYIALSKCARELELELGLSQCHERAGKYLDVDLLQRLRLQREHIEKRLVNANDWQMFHRSLTELGVGVRTRRSGAVFLEVDAKGREKNDVSVPASRVDRSLSRKELERRLGVYQPPLDTRHRDHDVREHDDFQTTISDDAKRRERHSGTKSFQRWVLENRKEIASIVREAESWNEVHAALASMSMEIVRFRKGLSLKNANGRGTIAASQVARDLSLGKMETRLGEFQKPAREREGGKTSRKFNGWQSYDEQPFATSNLWQQYLDDRDLLYERKTEDGERRQLERDRAFDDLREKFKEEANSIKRNLLLTGFAKKLAYRNLLKRQQRRYDRLKQRPQASKRHVPTYRQWLLHKALRGNHDAREALEATARRLSEPAQWEKAISGHCQGEPVKRRKQRVKPNAVFPDGAIEIDLDGVKMIDHGNRLHATESDLHSVRKLLEAARERYQAPLQIQGDDTFLANVVICALDMPELTFDNPELQNQLDVLRSQKSKDPKSIDHDHSLER